MAEEGSKLQRMDGEMLDEGLPEEPKEDSPQSLQCKEIIAEMKIEHDKGRAMFWALPYVGVLQSEYIQK